MLTIKREKSTTECYIIYSGDYMFKAEEIGSLIHFLQ